MSSPLLLIHGFTDTRRTWDPLIPLLEPHHELIVPTLVGHRGGPVLSDEDRARPREALIEGLERELDSRGHERVHIVGNSLGGWLAFELAARGRALSVLALSPANGWETDTAPRATVRLFMRAHRLAPIGKRFADKLAARPGLRRLALRDVVTHGERIKPDTARELILGNSDCDMFEPLLDLNDGGDYRSRLDLSGVPVRIAWGSRDRVLPIKTCSNWHRSMLPDAEWVDLPGCGHLPHHDDPELVARLALEVTAAPVPV